MGRTIIVDGEPEDHEEDKKIKDLKKESGMPSEDIVVYDDGSGTMMMADEDTVGNIPEGATVTSQPDKGRLFG